MFDGAKTVRNTSNVHDTPLSSHWWTLSGRQIQEILEVDYRSGLSAEQVRKHRASYGTNALVELKRASIIALMLEGIKEPMMVLLLSVAVLSFIFGESVEAFVMIFVVVAYVSVEFVNKLRTDRTMARLRELTQPTTKVIREDRVQEIPTADVVVGDLIIVSAGVRIPADARLVESSGLLVNEAALTGESLPMRKEAEARALPCACTGGIYMTFLSLIAESAFKLAYLLVYNIIFVIPLAVILLVFSSKQAILRFRKMLAANAAKTTLILGILMTAVGLTLLIAIWLGVQ